MFDFDTETAYGIMKLSPLYEKLEMKFPRFLEFSKGVFIEYLEDDLHSDDDLDDLFDQINHYETLYENGEISRKEFEVYVLNEEKRKSEARRKKKLKIIQKKGRYILYLKRTLIVVDTVVDTVAKTYFCRGNDELWDKTEMLFYAILERNLDMNEENLHVYVELLSYIHDDTAYAEKVLVDRLRKLDEFRNAKDIKDVLKNVSLDNNALSKSLTEFLLRHARRVLESKGDEFRRSKEILKAILSLV